jgi:hypothetical protein
MPQGLPILVWCTVKDSSKSFEEDMAVEEICDEWRAFRMVLVWSSLWDATVVGVQQMCFLDNESAPVQHVVPTCSSGG